MSRIIANNIRHNDASADSLSFDSNARVGIGTTSPGAPLDIVSNSSAEALRLRGRSADEIGSIYFQNNAGSTNYAYIQSRSTYLDIATETTNPIIFTTNQSERMRLLSGGGLTFNGDTATANALDDYEEGTWTPVLKDNSGNEATMTTQEGYYTKTGNIVNAWFQVAWSNIGSMSGNVRIEGWPVTSKANSSNYYYIGATISNQTTVGCIAMAGNGTVANFQPLTGPTSNQTASNLDSSGRMMCSLTYLT